MSKVQVERDWLEYYENSLMTQSARLEYCKKEITRQEELMVRILSEIKREKSKISQCYKKIYVLSSDKKQHSKSNLAE